MALNLTVSALIARVRKRADKYGDEGLTDSDIQALLAEVYRDLYTRVAETGHRYFETVQSISATGATSYTLATDHMGTVRVERVMDTAGRCLPLREVSAQEQTYWKGLTGSAYRFALADDQLYLLPTPPTGDTYKVYYIPLPPDLTTYGTSDNVDVVVPHGESFLVNGAAAIAKGQTDGDNRWLMAERDRALENLVTWASLRAFSQAPSPFVEDDVVPGFDPFNQAGFWNRPR